MPTQTSLTPPAPCPDFCTREAGHGLRVAGAWRRIHLADPIDTPVGTACCCQSDTVSDTGEVTAGPLTLAAATVAVDVVPAQPARRRAVAA